MIRGDFICMGSDMICQHSFGEIADLHRSRGSDLTMLLVSAPSEDSEKKGKCVNALVGHYHFVY